MNFEYFIVKRLISTKKYKSSISAPIIKIAIAAIAIGVVVMLISFATSLGLQEKIRDKISAFNGHINISSYDNNSSKVSLIPVSTDQDFYPDFKTVSGIEHVQAVASTFAVIRTETDFEGIIVKGVGNDYKWDYFEDFLTEGKLPDYTSNLNDEVLISAYLANRLGLEVGDRMPTFFLRDDSERPIQRGFKVTGIYDSGFQEFDELYVISDIRHLQRINNWKKNEVGNFEVFVTNFDELDAKGDEVYENTGSFLDTQTIVQKYYSTFEWLSLFDFNTALILGIMILVAGINMITALLVLILERTQMIGILKGLGAGDWSIRKIFLYNAAYLIVLGLFWGNLIGLGLLLLQKYFGLIPLDPRTYYVNEVPIFLSWDYILLVNAGTLVLCMLMLLIPSVIISRISPVKAIKFE